MRIKASKLVVAGLIAAAIVTANPAGAVEPCPAVACVVVNGTVVAPHGERVADYTVIAQRADGYHKTSKSNATGAFTFTLPLPTPNQCYQIAGMSDPFYTVSNVPQKQCSSSTVTLHPRYRINGLSGQQKVYLGSAAENVEIPVEVSALSRTYPAPFANDPLPYVFSHHHPDDKVSGLDDHVHHGATGFFDPPVVRKIADGVWQYRWIDSIKLPGGQPGYYDMDWGRGTSVFNPMMECRMIWFGYGISKSSPAKATPGTIVTIDGQRLGTEAGAVVIKGSGQVTTISGSSILEWTPTRVKFIVPPTAKSGWVEVVPPSGVPTNAQPLGIGV
ncbi:MAG TPA: IPT/TIG domain-containing protein [Actinomycetota bacterium]|nr:IPT/TIG domain-containing protein [Actinomycetota bacterium]